LTARVNRREETVGKYPIGMNGAVEMKCDLPEQVAIIDELGYDYVELRNSQVEEYLKENTLADLRALLARSRVKPLSVNALQPLSVGSETDRRRLVESADWHLRTAAATGCPYVVACWFGGPEGLPVDESTRQVVEGVKLVSDLAAHYGVKIAYEPLGNEGYPIHTVTDTMRLLQTVARANVGWLLDIYHFHAVGDSLEALANSDVDKLYFVHMNDVKDLPSERLTGLDQRVLPGDGVADLRGIISTLHGLAYKGPFSVELFNAEFSSWNPREFARTAKQKTEAILDKYWA
jgi:2-keto-myo-inositol isomerase